MEARLHPFFSHLGARATTCARQAQGQGAGGGRAGQGAVEEEGRGREEGRAERREVRVGGRWREEEGEAGEEEGRGHGVCVKARMPRLCAYAWAREGRGVGRGRENDERDLLEKERERE